MMKKAMLAALAIPGATYEVRVTPRARRPAVVQTLTGFAIAVTAPAEDGRATAAVQEALADALGVAKTRLTLIRGQTSRDKVFRLD
jgi:uncharacterized protein